MHAMRPKTSVFARINQAVGICTDYTRHLANMIKQNWLAAGSLTPRTTGKWPNNLTPASFSVVSRPTNQTWRPDRVIITLIIDQYYCFRFLADVNSRSRSLYAIGRPSVVCLSVCLSVCRLSSVTLVRPTQPVEIFGNIFHHTIAQGV